VWSRTAGCWAGAAGSRSEAAGCWSEAAGHWPGVPSTPEPSGPPCHTIFGEEIGCQALDEVGTNVGAAHSAPTTLFVLFPNQERRHPVESSDQVLVRTLVLISAFFSM
jgi:hypothetical protein